MDINGGQHKDMDAIWLESLDVYYYIIEYCLQQIILYTVLFYIVYIVLYCIHIFVKLHSDPQYVWPRFQVPAVPASIHNQNLGKVSTPNGDKLIWLHPRSHSFSRETWVELSWVADFTLSNFSLDFVGFVEGLLIRECCHPFHVISLASVLVMLAQPIEIP